jgi:hypothetical protein
MRRGQMNEPEEASGRITIVRLRSGIAAEEMGSSASRGKRIWILASSRHDLIEVDLKRPGRIDVKIPLFPTTTSLESFGLSRMLCQKRGINIDENSFAGLENRIPLLLTPRAAETLAVKMYRLVRTSLCDPLDALRSCSPTTRTQCH